MNLIQFYVIKIIMPFKKNMLTNIISYKTILLATKSELKLSFNNNYFDL